MVLRAGFLTVALKIQEAATAMCHEDIRTRLSDALSDAFRGTGNWSYIVAVFGDDKAGDVVYSCDSDLKKASYTIAGTGAAKIETSTAVNVLPLTTYEVETAGLTEAGARHSKRDLTQLQTIHDASAALGATCGAMQEAAKPTDSAPLKLVESFGAFLEEIPLREGARINYPIRIINPGTGSTAHYSADVLKREAGKFKPGTLMFWNHPTPAEEAARPEGDLNNLAAITTSQGVWKEDGPKGPGIYAEAKVLADYAERVQERAPHIGLSIRAGGERDGNKLVEGKPVLKEFSYIESVDYVTKAGRGGLALAEAARDAGVLEIPTQEAAMAGLTSEEATKLIEAAVAKATAPYQQRLLRSDAREEATGILRTVQLPQVAKDRIIERATSNLTAGADGSLDLTKLRETVVAEAKAEGDYIAALNPGGRVFGMGAPVIPFVAPKPEEIAAREAAEKSDFEAEVKIYERQGMTRTAAEWAARGREEDVA